MKVSILQLHGLGFFVRLALIVYGEWQDKNFQLKFTDVDYHVFTDAAKYVLNGETPYARPTYRYTPLISWILIPCHLVHMAWGKLIFAVADSVTGFVIQRTLELQSYEPSKVRLALCLWLFNPISMTISARGNAESLLSAVVISTIYALLVKCRIVSGLLYGLSIHLKIFPLVSSVSIFLYLGSELCLRELTAIFHPGKLVTLCMKIFCRERVVFFFSTCILLAISSSCFFLLYGHDFVENAYLYHITRKDIRHNFSVYFYMLYTNSFGWLGLLCFISQALIITSISVSLYKHLPLCIFLVTFSFVSFNKICTSQYFLWYLTLIPLVAPSLNRCRRVEVAMAAIMWYASQCIWLASAYRLEFGGKSVFIEVWISSLFFFCVNVVLVVWLLKQSIKHA